MAMILEELRDSRHTPKVAEASDFGRRTKKGSSATKVVCAYDLRSMADTRHPWDSGGVTITPNKHQMNILAFPTDSATDAELIQRWLNHRDQAAARALHSRYEANVQSIASRHAFSQDEIDDACQLVWQSIFAALPRFDATRPFAHWLRHIARCLCMRHAGQTQVHASRFQAHEPEAPEFFGEEPKTQTTGADITMHRESLRLLERGMADWKPVDRQILRLIRLENADAGEVSRRLGISENALRIRLSRLTERLRELRPKCA